MVSTPEKWPNYDNDMPIFAKNVEKPSLRDQMQSILGDCEAGRIPQEEQKMQPVGRNPQQFWPECNKFSHGYIHDIMQV